MTPHSPADLLPEQRVGAAMREARKAKSISLRDMAKKLGYNSHTTLSAYERGSVMPTDEVVTSYEQHLGLSTGSLTEVLESARLERHGDVWAKRRARQPGDPLSDDQQPERPVEPARPLPRWRHRRRYILIGLAGLVAAATTTVITTMAGSPPEQPGQPPVAAPDGSDPQVTGCRDDAVGLDYVDIHDPPGHLVGTLELRSSPRCGMNWGRFNPTVALATTPPLELTIEVRRPADGARAPFAVTFDGQAAYGNMLLSRQECVYAVVTLQRAGAAAPAFQTGCAKAPTTP